MAYSTPLEARIAKQVTRAITEHGLIEDGDRVMVGLSGGKDSWALIQILDVLRRRAPIDFSLVAVTVDSGYKDYKRTGSVCGIALPAGLRDSDRLEPAIFTPATKAETGHDENIPFETMAATVGRERADEARRVSLEIYERARAYAEARGIILADTKVEFGIDPTTGDITLGDEVLTPDSSRFWDAETYEPGKAQPSFDKQFVRDWLTSPDSGWDRTSDTPPPALPEEIVQKTRARYVEAYERLTGRTFA